MIDLIQAILALDPNAKVALNNIDAITWYDGNPKNITKEQIETKLNELQSAYDALDYQRKRKVEFDEKYPIGDQLDYIFHHGLAKWKSDIVQPIKDKFPKP